MLFLFLSIIAEILPFSIFSPQNKRKKPFPIGSIKFKIDKEKSKTILNDENIVYPNYELASKQDGDFSIVFDENTPIG